MKYYFDGVIVVEGTGDSSYLSSFIEAMYVESNGFDIKETDIDFLAHCDKRIILLLDSDEAGELIRQRLHGKLPSAIDVRTDISKCNKNNKHGVAECDKEEIIKSLRDYIDTIPSNKKTITTADLIRVGIDSLAKRKYLSDELHIGTTNNKEFIKRINFLEIGIGKLKTALEKYNGNK